MKTNITLIGINFYPEDIAMGNATVVCARSSVFKDLPAGKVSVGSPAKVIKARK